MFQKVLKMELFDENVQKFFQSFCLHLHSKNINFKYCRKIFQNILAKPNRNIVMSIKYTWNILEIL